MILPHTRHGFGNFSNSKLHLQLYSFSLSPPLSLTFFHIPVFHSWSVEISLGRESSENFQLTSSYFLLRSPKFHPSLCSSPSFSFQEPLCSNLPRLLSESFYTPKLRLCPEVFSSSIIVFLQVFKFSQALRPRLIPKYFQGLFPCLFNISKSQTPTHFLSLPNALSQIFTSAEVKLGSKIFSCSKFFPFI